tara:strand:- start:59532 stop:60590 length:1059 start_codon:yes stop_codon:yes gene_type:complete
MSAQWFNPLEQTPEGLLLKDVRVLLKEVKNKKKADLDNDGKLSSYEKKRGKAIEQSMARQGYKSNRGQTPPKKLPRPKGNKNKIDKTTEILIEMGIIKNTNCSECKEAMNKNMECHRCAGVRKASMDEKDEYCRKNFGREYSKCTPKQQAQCDRHCGKVSKAENHESKIRACLKEKGGAASLDDCAKVCGISDKECKKIISNMDGVKISPHGDVVLMDGLQKSEIKKYSQESSVENLKPIFENVDGGKPVRAHGFTTNGTYPATNDGPKKSIISENAKIPSVAQKGYTVKSSSLHMHYNDAGGNRKNPPNIDTIEQRLASLTKHAGRNNLGIIGEIEGLLKQVRERTENPSN